MFFFIVLWLVGVPSNADIGGIDKSVSNPIPTLIFSEINRQAAFPLGKSSETVADKTFDMVLFHSIKQILSSDFHIFIPEKERVSKPASQKIFRNFEPETSVNIFFQFTGRRKEKINVIRIFHYRNIRKKNAKAEASSLDFPRWDSIDRKFEISNRNLAASIKKGLSDRMPDVETHIVEAPVFFLSGIGHPAIYIELPSGPGKAFDPSETGEKKKITMIRFVKALHFGLKQFFLLGKDDIAF